MRITSFFSSSSAATVLAMAVLAVFVNGSFVPNTLDAHATKRVERLSRLLTAPRPPLLHEITKFRSDVAPIPVDYGGQHPFEKRRNLQFNPAEKEIEYGARDTYKPIRFKFITEPLESLRGTSDGVDAKIDTIINDVLPAVESNWTAHLSVFPAVAPIPIAPEVCFGIYDEEIPQTLIDNGVEDSDIVILVSAKDTLQPSTGPGVQVCGTSTLAVATSCSRDQFDRPVIGFINFCLPEFPTRKLQDGGLDSSLIIDDETIADTKLIGTHEVGHVLGVDMTLYSLFRNGTTGEPLTERDASGGPVARTVTCVDGITRTLPFPAANTLQQGQTDSGIVFFDMVTPRVRTVARNHFNCQSLAGARLENQPTNEGVCVGTHWDERVWYTELLGPIFSGAGDGQSDVLSPLTLALMEDSGWYKVKYGEARLAPYGHGAGCDFVNGDCIINDQVPDYGEGVFCDTPLEFTAGGQAASTNPIYCDPSHTIFAFCNLFDETASSGFDVSGVPLRYFTDQNLASLNPQLDFCPLPTLPFGIDCTDSDETGPVVYAGETYGPDSRCINAQFQGASGTVIRPACLPIVCDEENFQVVVGGVPCEEDGQVIDIAPNGNFASSATFTCPPLASICPQLFCPGACSGRGVCNYDTTPAQCECFDPSDTTPECKGDETVFTTQPPTPPSGPTPPVSGGPPPVSSGPDTSAGSTLSLSFGLLVATLVAVVSVVA